MICDHTAQIDIRKLPKEVRPLPDVIHFEGERIVTTWTSMHFGGHRQWFLCPSCDRRCAVIYSIGGGSLWGCRICMDGRYACEHKSPQDRRFQKAFKIRKRLGQTEKKTCYCRSRIDHDTCIVGPTIASAQRPRRSNSKSDCEV